MQRLLTPTLLLSFAALASAANPIITHKYTADPAAIVHDETVYLYAAHDQDEPGGTEFYVLEEWLCFSSTDRADWKEEGVVLKASDFKWASGDAWASQVIDDVHYNTDGTMKRVVMTTKGVEPTD